MAKFHLTNKAVADLSEIWKYTSANWSMVQADKYYYILLDFCKTLAEKPDIGKNYNEITKNLHGYKVNQHIIFYRVISGDEIEIVRILHSRMDLKNRLKD